MEQALGLLLHWAAEAPDSPVHTAIYRLRDRWIEYRPGTPAAVQVGPAPGKRLWGISISARQEQGVGGTIIVTSHCVRQESEDAAEAQGLVAARAAFPNGEGWTEHVATVCEVPDNWITERAEEMRAALRSPLPEQPGPSRAQLRDRLYDYLIEMEVDISPRVDGLRSVVDAIMAIFDDAARQGPGEVEALRAADLRHLAHLLSIPADLSREEIEGAVVDLREREEKARDEAKHWEHSHNSLMAECKRVYIDLAEARAEVARLRAEIDGAPHGQLCLANGNRFICTDAECANGVGAYVDEDGCCTACGADTTPQKEPGPCGCWKARASQGQGHAPTPLEQRQATFREMVASVAPADLPRCLREAAEMAWSLGDGLRPALLERAADVIEGQGQAPASTWRLVTEAEPAPHVQVVFWRENVGPYIGRCGDGARSKRLLEEWWMSLPAAPLPKGPADDAEQGEES